MHENKIHEDQHQIVYLNIEDGSASMDLIVTQVFHHAKIGNRVINDLRPEDMFKIGAELIRLSCPYVNKEQVLDSTMEMLKALDDVP